jgi:hypothetical protein
MSYYSFEHIVKECYDEKAAVLTTARGKTTGAKLDIYANSWIALNAWIESRLSQQKVSKILFPSCFPISRPFCREQEYLALPLSVGKCWKKMEKPIADHCSS